MKPLASVIIVSCALIGCNRANQSQEAIRAGVILAKLLFELHLRTLGSHFRELTLNYRMNMREFNG